MSRLSMIYTGILKNDVCKHPLVKQYFPDVACKIKVLTPLNKF